MKKVYFITFLIFFIIIYKIININILSSEYYNLKYAYKTNLYVYGESAPRGRILDVNGNVIVDNEEIYVINYINTKDSNTLESAYILAEILTDEPEASEEDCKYFIYYTTDTNNLLTSEELTKYKEKELSIDEVIKLKFSRIDINNLSHIDKVAANIYLKMIKNYSYDKKTIASAINYEQFAKISELNIPGILPELSFVRTYPYGETLKSVLGTIGPIYYEEVSYYENLGYKMTDIVGRSYIEYAYESVLKGENAIYKSNNDGTLTLIKEQVIGADVYLSIDITVQLELEKIIETEIINAKSFPNTNYFTDAFVALSNPLSGEIIAMSGKRLIDNSKNYSFTDITHEILTSSFTVGSVIKAASMTVGYNYNLIETEKIIYDSCVKLYYIPEKCSWKSLGNIDDIEALRLSSNYYQYLIAIGLTGNTYSYNMKLDATKEEFEIYRETFKEYGLGTYTGIDLPGETIGFAGNTVADDLLLNLSIGQYDTYTLLGILQYVNTLANNKTRLELSIVNEAYNATGDLVYKRNNNILNHINIDDYYYDRILEGLNQVTLNGTGYGYIENKYNPAGKTGTSETFLDIDLDGVIDVKTYTKSFVGYAPFDDPKYSIAIITPHISYKDNSDDDYIYNISRYISLNITNFLFENS